MMLVHGDEAGLRAQTWLVRSRENQYDESNRNARARAFPGYTNECDQPAGWWEGYKQE